MCGWLENQTRRDVPIQRAANMQVRRTYRGAQPLTGIPLLQPVRFPAFVRGACERCVSLYGRQAR